MRSLLCVGFVAVASCSFPTVNFYDANPGDGSNDGSTDASMDTPNSPDAPPSDATPDATDAGNCQTVQQMALGGSFTCALSGSNTVTCWGDNTYGQLGAMTTSSAPAGPVQVVFPAGETVTNIAAGGTFACALTMSHNLYCWGDNTQREATGAAGAAIAPPTRIPVIPTAGVPCMPAVVSLGDQFGCVICAGNNGVECWGNSSQNQLATAAGSAMGPVLIMNSFPINISGASLAVGADFACAPSPAALNCWGDNTSGQLGFGTTGNVTPAAISRGWDAITQMSGGGAFLCAQASAGGVICAGDNSRQQIGTVTGFSSSPVSLGPTGYTIASGTATLAAGNVHGCAVQMGAGGVDCWGSNGNGQLARTATVSLGTPTAIMNLPALPAGVVWASVYAGHAATTPGTLGPPATASGSHTCVVSSDGRTTRCWGNNNSLQLSPAFAAASFGPATIPCLP